MDTNFDKTKNKLLIEVHRDETGIVRKMYVSNACFEELFGSLCGHTKQKNIDGIPALIERLKENNLLFSSKKVGVDYIKSGVESGIHKKGFSYFFVYVDENGYIFVALVIVFFDGYVFVNVDRLSSSPRWDASCVHRFVVPATKILDTQS